MILLPAVLISIALAVFVIAPLLAAEGPRQQMIPIDVTPIADLKRRRLVLYENLQDLEFEYKSGKIARRDYDSLRENYTAEAAELMLASQEAEKPALAGDAFIEREVIARRARRRASAPSQDYKCPKCGFENPLPVKFCGDCGAALVPRKRK
jgi:DNA-directed RNA polymerase subunit M/transcription elongation factor TFIIS